MTATFTNTTKPATATATNATKTSATFVSDNKIGSGWLYEETDLDYEEADLYYESFGTASTITNVTKI